MSKSIRKSKGGKKSVDAATMAQLIKDGKVPPQYAVPKSDGHDAIHAWIDLLADAWKQDRARRIDAIVTRVFPDVHKAIKWHGLWYGTPGQGWFLAVNAFKAYLKLTFMNGESLTPVPPTPLKAEGNAALDLKEADDFDEKLIASWIEQAHLLPGWGKA